MPSCRGSGGRSTRSVARARRFVGSWMNSATSRSPTSRRRCMHWIQLACAGCDEWPAVSSRARWVYRLHGLLAMLGLLAAVAALAVAARVSTLSVPSGEALLASCGSWLGLQGSPTQLLVLALSGLGLA